MNIPCESAVCLENGLALISPVPLEQANQTGIGYILLMKNQSASDEYRVMKTSNFKGLFSGFNDGAKLRYKMYYQQSGDYEGYLAQSTAIDESFSSRGQKIIRISRINLKNPYLYIDPLVDTELPEQSTEIKFSDLSGKTQILSFNVSLIKSPNKAPVFIKKRLDLDSLEYSSSSSDPDSSVYKSFNFDEYFELEGNGIDLDNPLIAKWSKYSTDQYASLSAGSQNLFCEKIYIEPRALIPGQSASSYQVLGRGGPNNGYLMRYFDCISNGTDSSPSMSINHTSSF